MGDEARVVAVDGVGVDAVSDDEGGDVAVDFQGDLDDDGAVCDESETDLTSTGDVEDCSCCCGCKTGVGL